MTRKSACFEVSQIVWKIPVQFLRSGRCLGLWISSEVYIFYLQCYNLWPFYTSCKRISVYSLTFSCSIVLLPLSICIPHSLCRYLTTAVLHQPPSDLNTLCQHTNLQLSGQVCCQWYQCLTSTITHRKIGPCDPMMVSGLPYLEGLVLEAWYYSFIISSVVWPSQGFSEWFPLAR
jgi:hypothetical protein